MSACLQYGLSAESPDFRTTFPPRLWKPHCNVLIPQLINHLNINSIPNSRYEYDMSFMSEDVPLRLADRQIQPLYKHLVHTKYPTLAVIGVPIREVGDVCNRKIRLSQ